MTTKRTNEKQSSLDAMQAAMKDRQWPVEISLPKNADKCLAIFDKVLMNRPYDSWFEGDLLEVARYSRLLCDTEDVYEQLVDEGWTVMGGKSGTAIVENPLGRVHSNLSSQLNMIARRLNLATSYREDGNKTRVTQDSRAKKERDARRARKEVSDEDLLA